MCQYFPPALAVGVYIFRSNKNSYWKAIGERPKMEIKGRKNKKPKNFKTIDERKKKVTIQCFDTLSQVNCQHVPDNVCGSNH